MKTSNTDQFNHLDDVPADDLDLNSSYQLVARAIRWLEQHHQDQPSLNGLATALRVSDFHLQRLFRRWAGVTPKQFSQFLTHRHARDRLADHSVLDTALSVGLSGSSRLHDLTVHLDGATPGEIRSGGAGMRIGHSVVQSPFGSCFIAHSERGICALGFVDDEADQQGQLDRLEQDWPQARVEEEIDSTLVMAAQIFAQPGDLASTPELRLYVPGSRFQIQVWQALLRLPIGQLGSYGQIAATIGKPSSTRAVASAIARNRVGWLIPCHRVILGSGQFGQYRWGATRKQAMIGWEAARTQSAI